MGGHPIMINIMRQSQYQMNIIYIQGLNLALTWVGSVSCHLDVTMVYK